MRALKPVYEQMVIVLKDKKRYAGEDESEVVESQLNDLSLRWEAIEDVVTRRETMMEELEPKVVDYHEGKERFVFWLQETEEKLKHLPKNVAPKEYNNEAKVCVL